MGGARSGLNLKRIGEKKKVQAWFSAQRRKKVIEELEVQQEKEQEIQEMEPEKERVVVIAMKETKISKDIIALSSNPIESLLGNGDKIKVKFIDNGIDRTNEQDQQEIDDEI